MEIFSYPLRFVVILSTFVSLFNLNILVSVPNVTTVSIEKEIVNDKDEEETVNFDYILYEPENESDELVIVSTGMGMEAKDSACYRLIMKGNIKPDCYVLIVNPDNIVEDTPSYVEDLPFDKVYYIGFSCGGFNYSAYRKLEYNGKTISKVVLIDGSPKSIKNLDEVYYIAYYNDESKLKSVYKERYESVIGTEDEPNTYLLDNNSEVYLYDFRDIYEENSSLHSNLDYWCFSKDYNDENFGNSLNIFSLILD